MLNQKIGDLSERWNQANNRAGDVVGGVGFPVGKDRKENVESFRRGERSISAPTITGPVRKTEAHEWGVHTFNAVSFAYKLSMIRSNTSCGTSVGSDTASELIIATNSLS